MRHSVGFAARVPTSYLHQAKTPTQKVGKGKLGIRLQRRFSREALQASLTAISENANQRAWHTTRLVRKWSFPHQAKTPTQKVGKGKLGTAMRG